MCSPSIFHVTFKNECPSPFLNIFLHLSKSQKNGIPHDPHNNISNQTCQPLEDTWTFVTVMQTIVRTTRTHARGEKSPDYDEGNLKIYEGGSAGIPRTLSLSANQKALRQRPTYNRDLYIARARISPFFSHPRCLFHEIGGGRSRERVWKLVDITFPRGAVTRG